jgi:hypothetical protein
MIGRKIALGSVSRFLSEGLTYVVPKGSEKNHHDDGKNLDADVFCFLETLDKAIHERSEP